MLAKIKQFFTIDVDYKNRVYGFDIMRGIGILIVLYAHGRSKMHFFPKINDFITVIGFWLMDLFFVLSGFLIGMILIKFYEKEKKFNLNTAYNFWIRRWFRTLPNYYLVLIVTALLWSLGGNFIFFKLKFLVYTFFCQTITTPPPFFLMESWTLCIEEWFYLLFPLLLLAADRLLSKDKNGQSHIKRNILVSIIIFFTVPMILRIYIFIDKTPLEWVDISRMTFFRMDTIAVGIFMGWVNYYYKEIFIKYRNAFGVLSVVFLTMYLVYFYKALLPNLNHQTSIIPYTLFFVLSSFAALSLTVYMKEYKTEKIHFFRKFITIISLISYSLYIFHRSVVMYIIDELCTPKTDLDNILLFIAYAVGSILLSVVVFKYFELPMTDIREKLKR